MFYRQWCKNLATGLFVLMPLACGNRQTNVAGAPVVQSIQLAPVLPAIPQTLAVLPEPVKTFQSNPPAISFDYPCDWVPQKAKTAVLALSAPSESCSGCASLCLDIPKLPWHLPGMITLGMIAHGYVQDLKKDQIHDAVIKEQCPLKIPGANAQRITCGGTQAGKPSFDIAVLIIHADHVYILSADSDQAGYDTACKTLNSAVESLKWVK